MAFSFPVSSLSITRVKIMYVLDDVMYSFIWFYQRKQRQELEKVGRLRESLESNV